MPLPDLEVGVSESASSSVRQGGQSHTQKAKDIAIGALTTVLKVVKEASPAFPPLQGVAGGILAIKDVLAQVSSNAADIDALTDYMKNLNSMIEMSMPDNRHEALQTRLRKLEREVDDKCKKIENLRSQSTTAHLTNATATSEEIQGNLRALMWVIHGFIVGGIIDIEKAVGELDVVLRENFEHMKVHIEGQITGLAQQIQNMEKKAKSGDETDISDLRHAMSARFDSESNRVVCEDETRQEILKTVYHWIKSEDSCLTNPTAIPIQQPIGRRVFWLQDQAGTGKSTIAQTIAEQCDANDYLGASFFCARDSDQCSNVGLVFPTIAYQLCRIDSFKERVAKVLRVDSNVQWMSVTRQLQKLIAEPLRAVKSSGTFPPCAVIIDALDECKDDQATSVVLQALACHIRDLDPLKFFITSRPVPHIIGGFGIPGLKAYTQDVAMNSISSEITTCDIRQYLTKQLADVAQRYHIHDRWPSENEMEELVYRANGLFIFAATTARFIRDSSCYLNTPKAQLDILLSSQFSKSPRSPYQFLDALYTQVLRTASRQIHNTSMPRLNMVLGSIALIQDPLPSLSLDALLGLEHGTVWITLDQLRSLVIVPEHENDPIRLIHPSFPDFLTNKSRCNDQDFVVNPKEQHGILAQHCLQTLQHLRKDICKIEDPSKLNTEFFDLNDRVAKYIPLHLQYACKHWMFHVINAEINEDIYQLLKGFIYDDERMLHWLDALNLLDGIGAALEGLPVVRKMLQVDLQHLQAFDAAAELDTYQRTCHTWAVRQRKATPYDVRNWALEWEIRGSER